MLKILKKGAEKECSAQKVKFKQKIEVAGEMNKLNKMSSQNADFKTRPKNVCGKFSLDVNTWLAGKELTED